MILILNHGFPSLSPVVPPRGSRHIGPSKQGLPAEVVGTVQQVPLEGLGLLVLTTLSVLAMASTAEDQDQAETDCGAPHLSLYQ